MKRHKDHMHLNAQDGCRATMGADLAHRFDQNQEN
jgi:hypothetical protein